MAKPWRDIEIAVQERERPEAEIRADLRKQLEAMWARWPWWAEPEFVDASRK